MQMQRWGEGEDQKLTLTMLLLLLLIRNEHRQNRGQHNWKCEKVKWRSTLALHTTRALLLLFFFFQFGCHAALGHLIRHREKTDDDREEEEGSWSSRGEGGQWHQALKLVSPQCSRVFFAVKKRGNRFVISVAHFSCWWKRVAYFCLRFPLQHQKWQQVKVTISKMVTRIRRGYYHIS